ncbi:MAG: tetratricopeptide repeat protein [Verrucomicrobia bacterium]|nr:tetratricopeptide repeat protein [Verrucomicrobiota bacterium]
MNQPSDITKLLQSALASLQSGKLPEAQSMLQQVLAQDPDQFDALRLLGVTFGRQGDFGTAFQWFSKAARIKPDSARIHHDLGISLGAMGDFDRAKESLRQAVRLYADPSEAYTTLGDLHLTMGRPATATECYEKAVSGNPTLDSARAGLNRVKAEAMDLNTILEAIRASRPASTPGKASAEETKLPRRQLLPELLNRLGLTGTGVEIGVQRGDFSSILLRNWKGERLISIDPWREFPADDYVDVANVPQESHDLFYRLTLKRLMPFGNRSVVWRLTSIEGTELIPDQSLDFCYLDGDHSLEGVREDLKHWMPKVKPGGILAGHDYIPDGRYEFGVFGVKGAVDEFITRQNLRLFLTNEKDTPFYSWFVVVN